MTPRRPPAEDAVMPGLGVVGTAVLDRIHPWAPGRAGAAEPVESFGGVFYALHALVALAPHPAAVVPVLRVGADAHAFVRAELAGLGVDTRFLAPTAARQNAVELRYTDRAHRHEVLSGGVPALRHSDLAPVLRKIDALYLNFIAGNELALPTLRAVRRDFAGPVYADVHSLLLGRTREGLRYYRPLRHCREWLACFDLVQCNAEEAATLWRSWRGRGLSPSRGAPPAPLGAGDLERLARTVLELGPRLFVVTAGRGPVRAWTSDGAAWRFAPRPPRAAVDPTGCGDVLGAAFCALHFLRGLPERKALARAVEAAAVTATRVGTHGLVAELRAWYVARDD